MVLLLGVFNTLFTLQPVLTVANTSLVASCSPSRFRHGECLKESDFLMTISRQREIAELGVRLSTSSLSISRSLTLFGADKLSAPVSLPYEEIPLSGTVEICGPSQRKKSQQGVTIRTPSQKEGKAAKKSPAPVVIQLPAKPSSQGTKAKVVCSEYSKEERKVLQTFKHPQLTISPNSPQKASPQKKPKVKKTPKTNSDNFTCSLEDCLYHKSKDQSDQDKKLEPARTAPAPTAHKYRGVKKPEVGPGSEIRVPYRPKGGMIFDPELLPLSPKV
ncbi:uncharacterized protein LOC133497051 isoform X2 [Syngnathoides biaculeatus]|uniref:uncharacterized protein LOC133497051 isoform X2 n=1 Tax=Syngnathoides biaculeatus TaxID=300417 RepID=UPI002ADE0AB2|nr:uncharacterized protein LOC133497051 isoform X2 [Syngnathoides biaculeatus]